MHHFNNLLEQKEHRKGLRKKMTPQETILWSKLRRNGLGVKFRRQHSLGRYIADFYCTERKFVIELDGGQHFEQKEYDEERTKYFELLEICVLRVWNDEIYKNLSGVILKIEEVLRGRMGGEPLRHEYVPPPRRGEQGRRIRRRTPHRPPVH